MICHFFYIFLWMITILATNKKIVKTNPGVTNMGAGSNPRQGEKKFTIIPNSPPPTPQFIDEKERRDF